MDFNSQQVFLDIDHEPIEYTDLVIAVGSSGPFPGRPMSNYVNEATREYLNLSDEIEKANDIVIVGGGAVGVEIAGEIGEKYKLKRMTLIHPSEKFVGPDFSDKFQTNIKSALESFNVEMVLGKNIIRYNDIVLLHSLLITEFSTLRSLINVQSVINVQGDKFSKKNKRTGRKSSPISVQG